VMVFLFPLYLLNKRNVGPGIVGVFVSLTVVGRLVALWFGGSVSDRWGRLRALIPGLVAYAAILAGLSVFTHPVALGLWSIAVGSAAGFVMALPTALIGDRVPSHLQGVAVGWLRTMTDTGHVIGPLVMGVVADVIHVTAPFVCVAVLLALLAWRCHRLTLREADAP
jgi:MFS transporter, SP family, sugar:H+ symporter